jgi:hypothetical protein
MKIPSGINIIGVNTLTIGRARTRCNKSEMRTLFWLEEWPEMRKYATDHTEIVHGGQIKSVYVGKHSRLMEAISSILV